MSTHTDWESAARALSTYLDDALKLPPYAAAFSRWKGVQVAIEDDLQAARPTQPRAPKPQVILSLSSDGPSEKVQVSQARDCVLNVDVRANEFSGATPASGQDTSIQLLSQALASLLDEERAEVREALRAMGLYRVRWSSRRTSTQQVPGAAQQQTAPNQVSLTYFKPSS